MLGRNIKTIREYFGESQEHLAIIIGVSPATISHWESSFRKPKEENLKKLAQHYRVSIEELTRTDMSKYEKKPLQFNKQSFDQCIETMFPIIDTNDLIHDIHFQKGNRMRRRILQKCKEGKDIDRSLCEIAIKEYYTSWENNGNEQAIANLLSLLFLIISPQIMLLKNYRIAGGIRKKLNDGYTLGADFFQRYIMMDPRNEQEQKRMEERETFRKKFHASVGGTINEYIQILKKNTRWTDLGDYYMAMKFMIGIEHTSFDICLTQKMGRELMKVLAAQGNPYAKRLIQ